MGDIRRLDLLVRDARDQSGNQRYGADQGVPQREFVRYANDAQERIYNKMLQEHPSLFSRESFIDAEANEPSYALPTDVYLKHNIIKVDYSHNGNPVNYSPLKLRTPKQEISVKGYPESYFLRDGNMIISPIPSSNITNAFRLNYQYKIPSLDIRRATVTRIDVDTGKVPFNGWSSNAMKSFGGGSLSSAAQGIGTSGQMFVAGGTVNGIIQSSPDGITWTLRTSTLTGAVNFIYFANGLFVAGGTNGYAISPDGITWTNKGNLAGNPGTSGAYGNGTWIVTGGGRCDFSTDGVTWSNANTGFTSELGDQTVYDSYAGYFVSVGTGAQGEAAYSYDGRVWFSGTGFSNTTTNHLTYGDDGVLIAGQQGGAICKSTDHGKTWTQVLISGASNITNVVYGEGSWIATNSDVTGIYRSTDSGVTWTKVFDVITTSYVGGAAYLNGRFYASANSGVMLYDSADGITWREISPYTPAVSFNNKFFYVSGKIYAIGGVYTSIATLGAQSTSYTLQLDTTTLSTESLEEITEGYVDTFCLISSTGTQIATDLPILSYNSTTGKLITSYTGTALLDSTTGYITYGANSTTHCVLPSMCERYLTEYMALRAQVRDSNGADSARTSQLLQAIEQEIVDAIANLEEDVIAVPILDYSFLNYTD